MSDEETGIVQVPVHRTLPGLINEIMSKGRHMTYEELCNAVLPHWHNLRKHNGERYAYSSHSQPVLDCLRNRHEWAQLVDRGPKDYTEAKTHAEREVLRNSEIEDAQLEVVTLVGGLVGGGTILSAEPTSVKMLNSLIKGSAYYEALMLMQQILGSIPIVHIDDACEAHIFFIESPSTKGRFLCAVANPSSLEIAICLTQPFLKFKIADE